MWLRYSVRRPSGEYRYDREGSLDDEGQTLSCCHCGRTWHVKPGGGAERGWCWRCGAPTCGAKSCDVCLPAEEQLQRLEQRQSLWRAMER